MRGRCHLNHSSTVIILRSNPSSDFKATQKYLAISFTENTVNEEGLHSITAVAVIIIIYFQIQTSSTGICQSYIVVENPTPTLAPMRSPRRIVKKMILRSGGKYSPIPSNPHFDLTLILRV
jgi:hypothetical protein